MDLCELLTDRLTPARVWSHLDPDTRELAAQAIYADGATRREADLAVAAAMRFREPALRRLSIAQRVAYLLRAVHPNDELAGSLLLALHLTHRRPILCCFLSELSIPHEDGLIDPDHQLEPPTAPSLTAAIASLDDEFDRPHVDLYLACLVSMDPGTWRHLDPILNQRAVG
jgi:hypothetical protein